jgi:hypothetical protein
VFVLSFDAQYRRSSWVRCCTANVTAPLPLTAAETSQSLRPATTPAFESSTAPMAGRSAQVPGLRAVPAARLAVTVASPTVVQVCSVRCASICAAPGGRPRTSNSTNASRVPAGFPAHDAGQVASVVRPLPSPSSGTCVNVVSATAGKLTVCPPDEVVHAIRLIATNAVDSAMRAVIRRRRGVIIPL